MSINPPYGKAFKTQLTTEFSGISPFLQDVIHNREKSAMIWISNLKLEWPNESIPKSKYKGRLSIEKGRNNLDLILHKKILQIETLLT